MANKFNIGDKVKVSSTFYDRPFRGAEGIVRDYSGNMPGVDFGRKIGGYGHDFSGKISTQTGWYLSDSVLTLVEAVFKAKFKLGDEVEYTDSQYAPKGTVGKIARVPDDKNGDYVVDFNKAITKGGYATHSCGGVLKKNTGLYILEKNLKLVEKPVFKVGDRVRMTRDYRAKIGDTAVVRVVGSNDIGLEFDRNIGGHALPSSGLTGVKDGHGWWVGKEDIELLTFKVGDRVVIDCKSYPEYNGKIGTVKFVAPSADLGGGTHAIEFDSSIAWGHECRSYGGPHTKDDHGRWFNAEYLKPYVDTEAKPKFAVGDKVDYIGTAVPYENLVVLKVFKGSDKKTWRVSARFPVGPGGFVTDYPEDKFVPHVEPVKAEPKAKPDELGFIICVERGGKYAPAPTPRMYFSQNLACDVAKSMAERHGETFYVLAPVAKANPPVKVGATLQDVRI